MKTFAWMVVRSDNGCGLSVRASSRAEAIRKAQQWDFMRGAVGYNVRRIVSDTKP